MSELAGGLGIDQATFEREFADLVPQMVVARVIDGRLPVLPDVPNGKNAPLFQVKKGLGHVVAAVVNAAARQWAS